MVLATFRKELVARTGQLEFLIVANPYDHADVIAQALTPDRLAVRETNVPQAGDFKGLGAGGSRRAATRRNARLSRHRLRRYSARQARSGDDAFSEIHIPAALARDLNDGRLNLKEVLDQLRYKDVQVLMVVNPVDRFNVKGQHLQMASKGFDGSMNYAVDFTMKSTGATLLERLTADNQPVRDRYRRMGIIMDGNLISAPRLMSTIGQQGQITGKFSEQEVDFLVNILKSGRLPAVLRKEPISENQISALWAQIRFAKGHMR